MDIETLPTSRVVVPGTKRLELSQGEYLIVKAQLNAGETLDLFERAAPDVDITAPDARQRLSPSRVALGLVVAYLLDWDLTDLDGAPLVIAGATADEKTAALRGLDFDSLVEIINVITAHDAATRQEKKRRGRAPGS